MPTYQYACTEPSCAHEFELVQSFSDPAASECPVCGHRVRKVYGSVGVVFKGSGFYRTDSRSSGEGKSSDKAAAKSGESSSTPAKTESSAPAAKSESSSSPSPAAKAAAS